MMEAEPVATNGGDRKSTSSKAMQAMTEAMPMQSPSEGRENQPAVSRVKKYGTTNADYLAARIKRDRPDIASIL